MVQGPLDSTKGRYAQETFFSFLGPVLQGHGMGTCFEALYNIIFHRGIAPSVTGQLGEETLRGKDAVYLHTDAFKAQSGRVHEAGGPCNAGIIWGVLSEVVLDNGSAVKLGKTDQLGWKADGVELRAVWVVGHSGRDVPNTERVGLAWYLDLEAHPMRGPWAARLGTSIPIGLDVHETQETKMDVENEKFIHCRTMTPYAGSAQLQAHEAFAEHRGLQQSRQRAQV